MIGQIVKPPLQPQGSLTSTKMKNLKSNNTRNPNNNINKINNKNKRNMNNNENQNNNINKNYANHNLITTKLFWGCLVVEVVVVVNIAVKDLNFIAFHIWVSCVQ